MSTVQPGAAGQFRVLLSVVSSHSDPFQSTVPGMRIIGGCLVLALVLVTSGCSAGDESKSEAASATAEKSAAAEKAAEARQVAREKRKADLTAVYTECRQVMQPLDDKLADLGSRLNVGLDFEAYSSKVGDAQVAYDRVGRQIKTDPVSDGCSTDVGERLEGALNAYIAAYNTWNNCVNDVNCTFDKGSPALKKAQAKWLRAGGLTGKAETALSGMQPS
jgi:hypothetical protein